MSETVKQFIAFSGGVESSAMAVLYGKHATPVWTDTGYEHKPMIERIDMMERALRILHGEQSELIRIRNKKLTLPEYILKMKFYPNHGARFCTRLFKIEPMDDFLSEQGECEVFIGLNYDERDDREGNYGECKNVKYRYPLVEDKITRKDCEKILNAHGLLPNFPAYMRRGGCVGCFFKGKDEYQVMSILAPEEAMMVVDLEEGIQDKRGEYYHIHPSIPNMREFVKKCQDEKFLFPIEQMYKSAPTGKGCGVFCHR